MHLMITAKLCNNDVSALKKDASYNRSHSFIHVFWLKYSSIKC